MILLLCGYYLRKVDNFIYMLTVY